LASRMRKDTLGGLIAGAYIVIVGRLAGSDAGAIHSHSPHVHIGSMNTATENEAYKATAAIEVLLPAPGP